MKYENKVAVVTGGSSGIGAATALGLGKEGAKVVITYVRHKEWAEDIVRKIEQFGSDAIAIEANLKDPAVCAELINKAVDRFGGLDILVNCAGQHSGVQFMDLTPEIWDDVFDINMKAMFFCCQAAIPHMLTRGKGAIVNVSSTSGVFGGQGAGPAYTCSKHAAIGLSQQITYDFSGKGIRANTVCPGLCETPMTEATLNKFPVIRESIKRTPGGRICSAQDVANMILFLVSDEAEMVYGDNILVDGGLFESRIPLRG